MKSYRVLLTCKLFVFIFCGLHVNGQNVEFEGNLAIGQIENDSTEVDSVRLLTSKNGIVKGMMASEMIIDFFLSLPSGGKVLADAGIDIQELLDQGKSPLTLFNSGIPIDLLYGKTFAGGLIFYLDTLNTQPFEGLVAANSDTGNAPYGCTGVLVQTLDEIGSGAVNTMGILNDCMVNGIAAMICDDLSLNGFEDWFLPSLDELEAMRVNLHNNNLGNFGDVGYLSSSEEGANAPKYIDFSGGVGSAALLKDIAIPFRAARSF